MLTKLSEILDTQSKRRYAGLAVLSVASSLLQTAGVAAISLFFTVLLGGKLPRAVQGFVDDQSFLLLGVVVLFAALSGTISSGVSTYYGIKISWDQYKNIAGRLLTQYLDNPYEWHIQQHSSKLINAVLGEARSVCGILQQCVMVLTRGTEVVFLVLLLVIAKPMVALATFTSFATVYWLLFRFNREFIRAQGRVLVKANAERQKAATEALQGIKAVKIAGNAGYFRERFLKAAEETIGATVNIQYFSLMPKYFIESLLFGCIVGFVVLSHVRGWNVNESIPLLALYGAAALRMLPAAQQLYNSFTSLVAGQAVVDKVWEGVQSQESSDGKNRLEPEKVCGDNTLFRLENVAYRYPNSELSSLRGVDLEIKRGEKIGIVGTTGAGKTTLVDVLLQLLLPSQGSVAVAAEEVGRQHLVSYIPQELHFIDDTIAANIAWGIPEGERSREQLERAARRAQIHDHIVTLPQGYDTPMGERGVRLSGGQKQRIGIARALYLEPALLVLDEASNALDPETERQVLDTLFQQDLTLVVIAHRLSTLRKCDRLLVMREGRIVSAGSYEQLLGKCRFFREMAEADVGKVVSL
ncbi:MAG: ABC transporter ATP-binding protein [Vulcanimicrobiota bacterium]